jgi:hypothetical protein
MEIETIKEMIVEQLPRTRLTQQLYRLTTIGGQ